MDDSADNLLAGNSVPRLIDMHEGGRADNFLPPDDEGIRAFFTVVDAGHMPTSVPGIFATNPAFVTGLEAEGQRAFVSPDSARVIPVTVLGPSVPAVGDRLIADRVNGRWVSGMMGRKVGDGPPCGGTSTFTFVVTTCAFDLLPGASVEVYRDGILAGSGLTDSAGRWVFLPPVSGHYDWKVFFRGYLLRTGSFDFVACTPDTLFVTLPPDADHHCCAACEFDIAADPLFVTDANGTWPLFPKPGFAPWSNSCLWSGVGRVTKEIGTCIGPAACPTGSFADPRTEYCWRFLSHTGGTVNYIYTFAPSSVPGAGTLDLEFYWVSGPTRCPTRGPHGTINPPFEAWHWPGIVNFVSGRYVFDIRSLTIPCPPCNPYLPNMFGSSPGVNGVGARITLSGSCGRDLVSYTGNVPALDYTGFGYAGGPPADGPLLPTGSLVTVLN